MVLSSLDTRLIETKVFAVILIFSAVSGLNTAFAPYLSILFHERFGFSPVEFGFVVVLLNSLQYLLSPILFFVVLYVTCGGRLLNRVASVLTSLVFGSLVGYPIGSSIGSIVVAVQFGQLGALYYPLSSLPQHVVVQTLMGFAVLAFSDINIRWRSALPIEELQRRRPAGVTLLVALYVVFALLNTVAVPVLALYPSMTGSTPHAAVVVIAVGVVFGMVIAGQLVVAAGLYCGKKWGWITAVISSASSLMIDIYALGAMIVLGGLMVMRVLMLWSFVGFITSLAVLLYLLSIEVRKFFGFVNPPSQVQERSAQTECVQTGLEKGS